MGAKNEGEKIFDFLTDDMSEREKLFLYIRNYMSKTNVKQVDVTRGLNISDKRGSNIFSGKENVSIDRFLDILRILDLQLNISPKINANGLNTTQHEQ